MQWGYIASIYIYILGGHFNGCQKYEGHDLSSVLTPGVRRRPCHQAKQSQMLRIRTNKKNHRGQRSIVGIYCGYSGIYWGYSGDMEPPYNLGVLKVRHNSKIAALSR
jgi:hypothetical protein